ncbi:TetR/AcrR family transcriptional regulator [Telmatospirillum siberiense]|nr:TetR/AcrR family transcriptional regulator [Telmatospirillum siberiense]
MENAVRSERTRQAAIQAALAIIARDGPGRLTLDAIARESGISKGGLMHQFRTKQAVLKALLEHQIEHFEKFSQDYLASTDPRQPEAHLSAQIETLREAVSEPHSVAFAIVAALAEEPDLLSIIRDIDVQKIANIKAEAADPELAMLRWAAARGLVLSSVFGLCPFSAEERERLFARLLDARQWDAFAKANR